MILKVPEAMVSSNVSERVLWSKSRPKLTNCGETKSSVNELTCLALLEGMATSELPAESWMVLVVIEMKVLLVEVAMS